MSLTVRLLCAEDMEGHRLDALLKKRIKGLPSFTGLTVPVLYTWLRCMGENPNVIFVTAEDEPGGQLVGLFVATATHHIGDPVQIMADLLVVATVPGAMPLMVERIVQEAQRYDCKAILLTCETANTEVAARWGKKYGAIVAATTLYKEI